MNIRDYWLLKLPTIRKQSPYIGKLVENLLINDSKVSREILTEIVKLNQYIKLQEDINTEEKNELTKKVKDYLQDLVLKLNEKVVDYYNYVTLIDVIEIDTDWFSKLLNLPFSQVPQYIKYYKNIIEELTELVRTLELEDDISFWEDFAESVGHHTSDSYISVMVSSIILNTLTVTVKSYYSDKHFNRSIISFVVDNFTEAIVKIIGVKNESSLKIFFIISLKIIQTIRDHIDKKDYNFTNLKLT